MDPSWKARDYMSLALVERIAEDEPGTGDAELARLMDALRGEETWKSAYSLHRDDIRTGQGAWSWVATWGNGIGLPLQILDLLDITSQKQRLLLVDWVMDALNPPVYSIGGKLWVVLPNRRDDIRKAWESRMVRG